MYGIALNPLKRIGRKNYNLGVKAQKAGFTRTFGGHLSPILLLAHAILSIFIAEMCIMFLLSKLPSIPFALLLLIDSILLAAITFPILYALLFKPLCFHLNEHLRAEERLLNAQSELEKKVSERTHELVRANERLNEALAQLSKKTRNESIINEIMKSVHRSTNLEEVLENAVESMSRHVEGVDNVSIYFAEGDEAVMKAYRGYPDIFIKRARRIPYPKGFTWKTIIEGKPRYVPDVDKDDVIGPAGREAGTKSYLSMPIKFEGKTIGCININSLQKNAFDQDELNLLEAVASQIEAAIANAQNATLDWLTGCINKKLGMFFLEKQFKLSRREGSTFTICYVDIDDLKKVNDTWGHKEGDELIKIASSLLKKSLRESDLVCRMGGDEFLVILPNTNKEEALVLWERVEKNIAIFNDGSTKPYKISMSRGFAEYNPYVHKTPEDIIEAADRVMYVEKKNRKTRLVS